MPNVQKAWVTPAIFKTRDIDIFKQYCTDIRDHLDLVMVRTSDTGQVDIESLVAPTWATQQSLGYLVYRFNDALQATSPIFMRIEFWNFVWGGVANGASYQSQGGLQIRLIFGTGTDGAGAITNPSATSYFPFSSNAGTTAEAASRTADRSGINYLTYNEEQGFVFFVYGSNAIYRFGTQNNSMNSTLCMFSVQRTLDDYGQQDGRGFVVLGRADGFENVSNDYVALRIQTFLYSTSLWTTNERTNILTQSTGESSSYYFTMSDGRFLVYPINYWDSELGIKTLPNVTYVPNELDYPGVNYSIETIPNRPRKFRSLGCPSMWKLNIAWGNYNCLVLWD